MNPEESLVDLLDADFPDDALAGLLSIQDPQVNALAASLEAETTVKKNMDTSFLFSRGNSLRVQAKTEKTVDIHASL